MEHVEFSLGETASLEPDLDEKPSDLSVTVDPDDAEVAVDPAHPLEFVDLAGMPLNTPLTSRDLNDDGLDYPLVFDNFSGSVATYALSDGQVEGFSLANPPEEALILADLSGNGLRDRHRRGRHRRPVGLYPTMRRCNWSTTAERRA